MELVIEQNRKRNIALSLLGSLSSFIIGMGINFFLTPFIVRRLGVEANGFLGLANNFINYFSLVAIALHSMAGRFITLKICNGEMKEAGRYFNSLFISNVVLSIFVFFISLACVIHIEQLVKVPVNLVTDVKLTFAITFANYIIQILTMVFSISFFSTNKLYLQSKRLIQANLLRLAIILSAFMLFRPRIVYVAIGTIISGIYILINDIHYTKKLLPEIKVDHRQFEFAKVKELLASGVWNVVTKAGDTLVTGVDLLISNIFIGATAMGILAVSKTVPNVLMILLYSVAGVFSPEMTILYGQGRKYELKKCIQQAMRLLCVFVSVPYGIFIMYGREFFALWQPTQDERLLWILSVLAVASMFIIGPTMPLEQIFTITNKVYENSMVTIIYSVISFAATLVLLKTTDLGLYAIAGVSMAGYSLIVLAYRIPRAAVLMGLNWHTFYNEVVINILLSILVMAIGFFVKTIIPAHTWPTLIASGGLTAILALVLQWFVLLGKDTRNLIMQKVASKSRLSFLGFSKEMKNIRQHFEIKDLKHKEGAMDNYKKIYLSNPLNFLKSIYLSLRFSPKTFYKLPIRANWRTKIKVFRGGKLTVDGKLNIGVVPTFFGYATSLCSKTVIVVEANGSLNIGNNVKIYPGVKILVGNSAKVTLENNCGLNANTLLIAKNSISVGKYSWISWNGQVLDSDMHSVIQNGIESDFTKPISIGNNVWIGNGVTILKGVTINDGAIVAACSVVTNDVPSRSLVAGIPSKVIKNEVAWGGMK